MRSAAVLGYGEHRKRKIGRRSRKIRGPQVLPSFQQVPSVPALVLVIGIKVV
jgi:hypothetical protein